MSPIIKLLRILGINCDSTNLNLYLDNTYILKWMAVDIFFGLVLTVQCILYYQIKKSASLRNFDACFMHKIGGVSKSDKITA